jgi:hypothetical protein
MSFTISLQFGSGRNVRHLEARGPEGQGAGGKIATRLKRYTPSQICELFQTSGSMFLLMGICRVVLTGTLRIGSRAFIDRLHLRASYDLDLPGPSFF